MLVLLGVGTDGVLALMRRGGAHSHRRMGGSAPHSLSRCHCPCRRLLPQLICWKRGQASRVHNHGSSNCWLSVLSGGVEELRFTTGDTPVEAEPTLAPRLPGVLTATTPCPRLASAGISKVGVGATSHINDATGLHAVRCDGDACEEGEEGAVSLHIYAPPIRRVRLYEPDLNRCGRSTGWLVGACVCVIQGVVGRGEKGLSACKACLAAFLHWRTRTLTPPLSVLPCTPLHPPVAEWLCAPPASRQCAASRRSASPWSRSCQPACEEERMGLRLRLARLDGSGASNPPCRQINLPLNQSNAILTLEVVVPDPALACICTPQLVVYCHTSVDATFPCLSFVTLLIHSSNSRKQQPALSAGAAVLRAAWSRPWRITPLRAPPAPPPSPSP